MENLGVTWTSNTAQQTFEIQVGFRTVELDESYVDSENVDLGSGKLYWIKNLLDDSFFSYRTKFLLQSK